jgi:hypothetical protein
MSLIAKRVQTFFRRKDLEEPLREETIPQLLQGPTNTVKIRTIIAVKIRTVIAVKIQTIIAVKIRTVLVKIQDPFRRNSRIMALTARMTHIVPTIHTETRDHVRTVSPKKKLMMMIFTKWVTLKTMNRLRLPILK